MARPLRITYPGAFYHVTSRGNEWKDIFKSRRVKDKIKKDKKLERKISKIEKKIKV